MPSGDHKTKSLFFHLFTSSFVKNLRDADFKFYVNSGYAIRQHFFWTIWHKSDAAARVQDRNLVCVELLELPSLKQPDGSSFLEQS